MICIFVNKLSDGEQFLKKKALVLEESLTLTRVLVSQSTNTRTAISAV